MYDMNNEYNMSCFSLLPGRDGKKKNKCNGKAKNRCNRKGGSCVDAPFQEHCEEIYGSGGRLIKRACKSKHCQCCAPRKYLYLNNEAKIGFNFYVGIV